MPPTSLCRRALRWLPALAGLTLIPAFAAAGPATASPASPAPAPAERYLVQTAGPASAAGSVRSMRAQRIAPERTYDSVFAGYAADLTPGQVAALRQDPRVVSVTPDQRIHAASVEKNPTWGLDRIDQHKTKGDRRYAYDTTGKGVRAFVIDTGIRLDHREFGGRASSGYDFVDNDRNAGDCDGHGTHVAGTIGGSRYGVAKKVSLVAVRVLDCMGDGYESDLVAALDWVVKNRGKQPAVVNISIGGPASKAIDAAVKATVAAGVSVVAAAGNEGADACAGSPARSTAALTVGATSRTDYRASFSNYGSCVDIYAPGVAIKSAWPDSRTATEILDGTSMATPHVVGAVARYLQGHPHATPAQVRAKLVKDATRQVRGSHSTPDRLLFVRSGTPSSPQRVVATRAPKAAQLTMRWTAPAADYGHRVTGYTLTRSGRDAKGHALKPVHLKVSGQRYVFRGLRHHTHYTLTVRATNAVGPGTKVTVKITTR